MSGRIIPPSLVSDGIIRGSGVYQFGAAPPPPPADTGWFAYSPGALPVSTLPRGGVTVAADGSIYFASSVVVGGLQKAAIFKFDSAGTLQWQTSIGNATAQGSRATDVATDAAGNVYITGPVTIGALQQTFVAKFNSSGVLQWQRELRGATTGAFAYSTFSTALQYNGLAVSTGGDVYICTASRDTGPGAGFWDSAIVAKFDTAGVIQWQRWVDFSTTGSWPFSLALDETAGRVYIAGTASGAGAFVAHISTATGATGASASFNNFSGEYFTGVDIDAAGNVYVAGVYDTTGANWRWVMAEFDAALALQWQRQQFTAPGICAGYRCIVNAAGTRILSVGDGTMNAPAASQGATAILRDGSGTLQWVRSWGNTPTPDATYGLGAAFANNGLVDQPLMGVQVNNGDIMVSRAPASGAGVGAYGGGYTYVAGVLTEAAATLSASAATLATGASTLSDVAGTQTVTAIAQAFTRISIP